MDQKLNSKMINGNLLCKDITEDMVVSGFTIKAETKFKTLEVINSSDEAVPSGSKILVPYHTGQVYNDELQIINKKEIIKFE